MPKPKILIVEDDLSVATSVQKELEAEGYDVGVATTGDEGYRQAKEATFDVVISDLMLPGLSGLELLARLHSEKPKLPVILMTAFSSGQAALEATTLGAFGFLSKPFEMGDMLRLIARAVPPSASGGTGSISGGQPTDDFSNFNHFGNRARGRRLDGFDSA